MLSTPFSVSVYFRFKTHLFLFEYRIDVNPRLHLNISLDEHTDSVDTRKIAFTLHFTTNWKLHYGGLLYHLDEKDSKKIKRVMMPTHNTLTFFDVSRERFAIPHFVSEVVQDLTEMRLSITGWFQYSGEDEAFRYELY